MGDAMGIFGRISSPDADGFYTTHIVTDSIQPGAVVAVGIGRIQLLLSRVDDQIVAFSRRCPHAAGDLSAGALGRGRVTCPDHGWKFDLRTGRCLWPQDEEARLKTYPVRVAAGRVQIKVG